MLRLSLGLTRMDKFEIDTSERLFGFEDLETKLESQS